MTNPRPVTDPAEPDWFGGRRWTGIAALGVIIVLAVCVVVLVITRRGHDTATPPVAPPNSSAVAPSPSTSLPTTVPTTAPAGTTWSIFETIALPSVAGQGPATVTADGIATGYAHTPTGALVAAANSSYRYFLAGDRTWRRAADAMLQPGTGKDAWIAFRSAGSLGPGGATGSGDTYAQIAGYQFVNYSTSDAVIQFVTRDDTGVLQVGTYHVAWSGTDWLFVPADNGYQSGTIQQVDSLAGFIEWHGV